MPTRRRTGSAGAPGADTSTPSRRIAPASIDALLLAYLAAAAAGAFLLARALDRSTGAAALAAFGYALSGFVASMTGNLVFLAGAASLPWLILGVRACAHPGPGAMLGAAAATAAALLAGDAQPIVIGVLLGAALAAAEGGWRAAARGAAGVALGALLAGVQLLPSLAHVPRTVRHLGLTAEEQIQWALSPWRLLELFSPGFFGQREGTIWAEVFLGLAPSPPNTVPFADSAFLGLPVLLLALRGVRAGRRTAVLATAAAALLWLALGHHAGATQALGWVPVWGTFRYAEKLLGPLALALTLLAAHGLDGVLAQGAPRRRNWLLAAAGATIVWALLLWSGAVEAALAALGHAEVAPLAVRHLLDGLTYPILGLAALAAALLAPLPAPARGGLAAASVLAASAAALPFALHPAPSSCAGPGWLAGLEAAPPGPRIGTPNFREADPRAPDAWEQSWCDMATAGLPPYAAAARVDQLDTYTGLDPLRFLKVFDAFGVERWLAFRRFGLTHLVLLPPADEAEARILEPAVAGGRQVPTPPGSGLQAVAVPHRPWASFAPAVVAAPDPQATLGRLQALVAEGSEAVVIQAGQPVPAAPGRVLAARRGVESVEIEAEADGPALLVVNDAWWPGWETRIDGTPAPVLAADVLVRGIPFPAGRHTVVMRYEPPEVAWGLAASGLGAAGCLALAALAWRRRGRR